MRNRRLARRFLPFAVFAPLWLAVRAFARGSIRRDPATERRSVSPPVSLTLHVFARVLAEVGRTEDEDLKALRPGLVSSPCTGRNAHDVPPLDLDDLVVELHPPAPAHDHEHLLLLLVRVAVRKPVVRRDALIAQAALLELERVARETELQVRRAVEVGPHVRQILSEVPARERHGRSLARRVDSAAWRSSTPATASRTSTGRSRSTRRSGSRRSAACRSATRRSTCS